MRLKIILFAVFSLRAFSPSWARKRECHEIKIKYGTVAIEDSHLNFSCDKGYQLKGSESVPCQEGNNHRSANWSRRILLNGPHLLAFSLNPLCPKLPL